MATPSDTGVFADLSFEATPELWRDIERETVSFPERRAAQQQATADFRENFKIGLSALAFCAILMVLLVTDVLPQTFYKQVAIVAGAVGGAFVYTGSYGQRQLAKSWARYAREQQRREVDWTGRWRVMVSNSGVRAITPLTDVYYDWRCFAGVRESASFLAIMDVDGSCIAIPRSCLTSHEERGSFLRNVQDRLDACGASVRLRIQEFLTNHPFPCPACGYELKGSNGIACPECGLGLTVLNVPGARDIRPPDSAGSTDR